MVVFLRAGQRGAEQQVADPGLDEGKGGAVGVSGGHKHLETDGRRINLVIVATLRSNFHADTTCNTDLVLKYSGFLWSQIYKND